MGGGHHTLQIATTGRGLYDLTPSLRELLNEPGDGLCHLFIHHTSASIIITENADPEVHRDLERFFARTVPDGDDLFQHRTEGPDDMPAHVRSVLTQTHLTIPIKQGDLALGTWQGVYLWEHRRAAHRRRLTASIDWF